MPSPAVIRRIESSDRRSCAVLRINGWRRNFAEHREDELAVNLGLRVESQAYLVSAKNAVEQEVGNALSVCHEIWRTIELVVALHFRPSYAAFATWPSGLSGRLGYVRLQRLTSCVYP
jgi:hypothetical protein